MHFPTEFTLTLAVTVLNLLDHLLYMQWGKKRSEEGGGKTQKERKGESKGGR